MVIFCSINFVKRVFDILLWIFLLIALLPIVLPLYLLNFKRLRKITIIGKKQQNFTLKQLGSLRPKKLLNFWLFLREIIRGNVSFVGAPLLESSNPSQSETDYWYQPGITGLVQINRKKIIAPNDKEKYHIFYLKNQSLMLDLEILIKSFFNLL